MTRRPAGPLALLDRRASSLGCAMCGQCCEQIVLHFDPRVAAQWQGQLPDPSTDDGWAWWTSPERDNPWTDDQREHAIATYDGKRRDPIAAENAETYRDYWHVEWVDDGFRFPNATHPPAGKTYMVTCSAYDAEHRTCTHPNRPPICRDYPWYGDYPSTDRTVDRAPLNDGVTSCSYALDAPGWSGRGHRPLIPVTVLQPRAAAADGPNDDGDDQTDDGKRPQEVHGDPDRGEQDREDEQDNDGREHGDLLVAAW